MKIDYDIDKLEILKLYQKKENSYDHQGNYKFTNTILDEI
jgi:hypothetical protein